MRAAPARGGNKPESPARPYTPPATTQSTSGLSTKAAVDQSCAIRTMAGFAIKWGGRARRSGGAAIPRTPGNLTQGSQPVQFGGDNAG